MITKLHTVMAKFDNYLVSIDGEVITLKTNNIMKLELTHGYHRIQLAGKKYRLNRLMLFIFKGNASRVNNLALHRNDIKLDNRLENLYWGSEVDNAQDAIRNNKLAKRTPEQISKAVRGSILANQKLTNTQLEEYKYLYLEGETLVVIANLINIKYNITYHTKSLSRKFRQQLVAEGYELTKSDSIRKSKAREI